MTQQPLIIGFDLAQGDTDHTCLILGTKSPDGVLHVQHQVSGAEAAALFNALNNVPGLAAIIRRAMNAAHPHHIAGGGKMIEPGRPAKLDLSHGPHCPCTNCT